MFMLDTRSHRAQAMRPLPSPDYLATRQQLMEESERHLYSVATGGIPEDVLVADRLLANTRLFAHWQAEHDSILRKVTDGSSRSARTATLLTSALSLIHRKAVFEFMRTSSLRGKQRVSFVCRFFGQSNYPRTLVMEHGNYLRSAGSYLCATHIGTQIMRNPLFDLPLAAYEELYPSYFRASSELLLLKTADPLHGWTRTHANVLKRQVKLQRLILMRSAIARQDPRPTRH